MRFRKCFGDKQVPIDIFDLVFFSREFNQRITASKTAKHLINFSPNLNFLSFYNAIYFRV